MKFTKKKFQKTRDIPIKWDNSKFTKNRQNVRKMIKIDKTLIVKQEKIDKITQSHDMNIAADDLLSKLIGLSDTDEKSNIKQLSLLLMKCIGFLLEFSDETMLNELVQVCFSFLRDSNQLLAMHCLIMLKDAVNLSQINNRLSEKMLVDLSTNLIKHCDMICSLHLFSPYCSKLIASILIKLYQISDASNMDILYEFLTKFIYTSIDYVHENYTITIENEIINSFESFCSVVSENAVPIPLNIINILTTIGNFYSDNAKANKSICKFFGDYVEEFSVEECINLYPINIKSDSKLSAMYKILFKQIWTLFPLFCKKPKDDVMILIEYLKKLSPLLNKDESIFPQVIDGLLNLSSFLKNIDHFESDNAVLVVKKIIDIIKDGDSICISIYKSKLLLLLNNYTSICSKKNLGQVVDIILQVIEKSDQEYNIYLVDVLPLMVQKCEGVQLTRILHVAVCIIQEKNEYKCKKSGYRLLYHLMASDFDDKNISVIFKNVYLKNVLFDENLLILDQHRKYRNDIFIQIIKRKWMPSNDFFNLIFPELILNFYDTKNKVKMSSIEVLKELTDYVSVDLDKSDCIKRVFNAFKLFLDTMQSKSDINDYNNFCSGLICFIEYLSIYKDCATVTDFIYILNVLKNIKVRNIKNDIVLICLLDLLKFHEVNSYKLQDLINLITGTEIKKITRPLIKKVLSKLISIYRFDYVKAVCLNNQDLINLLNHINKFGIKSFNAIKEELENV
ncbi:hypothetical protein A3Q56_01503 [Intoshia linei]|uniref:RRP12 HEAT domain-containing protein n=1 Tax=Intoshia linei TaxID=1819745 RepID=A0A177BAS6_9BILA|nr:hypothetical protein A3Q56_01503 [Intoshia linei]